MGYFQVINPEPQIFGDLVLGSAVSSPVNGLLAMISTGELALSTGTTATVGILCDNQAAAWWYQKVGQTNPDDLTLMKGKKCGLLIGHVRVLLDKDYFQTDPSLQDVGANVYCHTSGGKYAFSQDSNAVPLGKLVNKGVTNEERSDLYELHLTFRAEVAVAAPGHTHT